MELPTAVAEALVDQPHWALIFFFFSPKILFFLFLPKAPWYIVVYFQLWVLLVVACGMLPQHGLMSGAMFRAQDSNWCLGH